MDPKEKDQIATMNDEPKTAHPGTVAPGTTPPGTEAPGTEAPGTEAPGTDEPYTEAPIEDKGEDEVVKLRKRVEELEGKKRALTDKEIDFLEGLEDRSDISPEVLNKLLNKVYSMGVTDSAKRTLLAIPDVVKANLNQAATIGRATELFYKKNADLQPHKKTVALIAEDLLSKNPDWTLGKVFEASAIESRKRLKLQASATKSKSEESKGTKPALPNKPKQSAKPLPKQKLSGLQKEIEDMNAAED
jgi:hypothetical protein